MDKSPNLIHSFVKGITQFLMSEKQCKTVVIACNTASATSYNYLRDQFKGEIPIINVIDPIIEAVVANKAHKKIGLIATKTTIESGVYQEKMKRRNPEIKMEVLPTPLLAPMIEEGFSQDKISKTVIENYLSNPKFKGIDALILGCTHYVLIKDEINSFFKGKVKLYDSTDILALKMIEIFKKEGLLNTEIKQPNEFFVSDFTQSFQDSAIRFYGENIKLQLKHL